MPMLKKNMVFYLSLIFVVTVSGIQAAILPDMPEPYDDFVQVRTAEMFFLAGNTTEGQVRFWRFDEGGTGQWQELVSPGSFSLSNAAAAIQHDGFDDCLWLFTDGVNYKYDIEIGGWKEFSSEQLTSNIVRAVSLGQSDIALITEDGKIYDYHTLTDTWKQSAVLSSDVDRQDADAELILSLQQISSKAFGKLNYIILAVYLLSMVLMGGYFSRREKTADDFFLAGRRVPWWAAGLSIFGTQLSAITFMAMPAKAYSSNWHYFIPNMCILLIAAPITAFIFIPFYRRLNVMTAYEYLEKRFSVSVRMFASAIYVLMQLMRMGVVLFLPALALATVTNIPVTWCIIIMGLLCTIYTVLGGIEAVIWTDVLQVIVLLGGALLCMVLILMRLDGDIGTLAAQAWDAGKFSLGERSWNLTRPTLLVILVSALAAHLTYVSDQTVVQRYLTTPSEKAAQKSLWTSAILTIPSSLLFFALGTALYMFYCKHSTSLDVGMSNDSIFPWFILNELPTGMPGLLIAGVFAAAMSSLDSSMNSASAAVISDFVLKKHHLSGESQLRLARILTVLFGLFGTATAIMMATYDIKSLWDLVSRMVGLFIGGLGGFFMLGALTRKANAAGALAGAAVSCVAIFAVQEYTSLHFFLFGTFSLVTACLVGYIVSLMTGGCQKDLTGLTIYSMGTK